MLAQTDASDVTQVLYSRAPFAGLISRKDTGPAYFHDNGQGSTVNFSDAFDIIVDTYIFDECGNIVDHSSVSGSVADPLFLWMALEGYSYDKDLKQYNENNRIIDPTQGRTLNATSGGFFVALYDYATCGQEEEEKKDKCCCCATGVTIKDGGLQAMHYAVDVDLNMLWKPSEKQLDCTLEWWEWSNFDLGGTSEVTKRRVKGKLQGIKLKAKKWWNQALHQSRSETLKPWFDETIRKKPTKCEPPAKELVTIHDTPGIIFNCLASNGTGIFVCLG